MPNKEEVLLATATFILEANFLNRKAACDLLGFPDFRIYPTSIRQLLTKFPSRSPAVPELDPHAAVINLYP